MKLFICSKDDMDDVITVVLSVVQCIVISAARYCINKVYNVAKRQAYRLAKSKVTHHRTCDSRKKQSALFVCLKH